jgi:hypothetical protein
MKLKLLAISCIVLLFISGNTLTASPDPYQEIRLAQVFSDIHFNETNQGIAVELAGTNKVITAYNHYVIPTKIETFTLPFGTDIKSIACQPQHIHSIPLEKKLQLTPEPLTIGFDDLPLSNTQSDPIAIHEWYSYDIGAGIIDQKRTTIVKIELYPVQYDEKQNLIQWAETIDICIEYKETTEETTMSDTFDFLILSPSSFSDELAPLVDHKNNRGLPTKLVTLDEIYNETYFSLQGRDQPENIKYFIKNAIEQWGIKSVLLVGSKTLFPTRETNVYVEYFDVDEPFISDLYYADIYNENNVFETWDSNNNNVFAEYDWGTSHLTDEVDLYPDVYLGRLACTDETQVITCVNKIITYEQNKSYTKDWFTNLVVTGGDTFTGDAWGIDEGEYMNQIAIDTLNGFIPNKIWLSNERLTGQSGANEITDAINQGCGFLHFSGHGEPQSWATHSHENENDWLPKPWGYTITHVMNLENHEKLPIVVLGACSTCKFNAIENCIGWSFLSNPNGGGIGSFGVTTYGYAYGSGTKMSEGFIGKMVINIFEAYTARTTDDTSVTFGDLWVTALNDYMYPNMEVRDYATIESYQAFGDPTLLISSESQPPEKPEKPTGSTKITPGETYTYSTSTTDPEEDTIYYLFDWGDNSVSEWIGPYDSGEQVETQHSWNSRGTYQIRVKAKDQHGQQSEWSEPLQVRLPKSNHVQMTLLKFIFEQLRLYL